MAKKSEAAGTPKDGAPLRVLLASAKEQRVLMSFLVRETRTRDGQIVAIKSGVAKVRLSEAAGHFATWGKDDDLTAMISADGYRHCNTVAQLNVLTPPTLQLDGVGVVGNPHVLFNDETGAFKAGWMRKVAIGPGPTGNMVLTDRTTYISLVEHLMEDLIGVSKRHPTAVLWGVRGRAPDELLASAVEGHNADIDDRVKNGRNMGWLAKYRIGPGDVERAKKRIASGLWGFYPVEPITGQGLWFDRTHEAIVNVFRTYAQTGKFGLRKLEGICYRNVLRDHPLMPSMRLNAADIHVENKRVETVDEQTGERRVSERAVDRYVDVPVFFHETIADEAAIRRIMQDFGDGLRTASFTVDEAPAVERADVRDVRSSKPDEEPPPAADDFEPFDDKPVEDAQSPEDVERARLLAQIRTGEEILGAGKSLANLQGLYQEMAGDRMRVAVDVLKRYLAALNAAVNQAQQQSAAKGSPPASGNQSPRARR